jgi:hypothetical protein
MWSRERRSFAPGRPGEPTENTGQYAKRQREDGALNRPLTREPERKLRADGALLSVTEFDEKGGPATVTAYDEMSDSGEQKIASVVHLRDGQKHDPDDVTPSVRSYTDGNLTVAMRFQHGTLQDPADGSPAVSAEVESGGSITIHYAGGKEQDPRPGVPAHVATLSNGMTRSTFFTQGTATKQEDRFPNVLKDFGIGNYGVTVTRTAE